MRLLLRVFLLGTRRLGFESLQGLLKSKHQIVGVCTEDYAITEGVTSSDFEQLANAHGIPFFKTDKVNSKEFSEKLRELRPDIGVSMYWRRLVKEPTLSVPRFGFINAHPADLPVYRGFAATSWSIVRGDPYTCMTIHKMVAADQADTGDILKKRRFALDDQTTIGTLWEQMVGPTVEMMLEVLDEFDSGTSKPQTQDELTAVNAYPRIPRDGEIDWNQSAISIDRLVRAVTRPYPGAYTYYSGKFVETKADVLMVPKKIFVWKAHVLSRPPKFVGMSGHVVRLNSDGTAWVTTGDGILVLDEIQFEGGKVVAPSSILNSYQIRFGIDSGAHIVALYQIIDELRREVASLKRTRDGNTDVGNES